MILVGTNILLDVLGEESEWSEWSGGVLAQWLDRGPLLINDVVYAEVSVGYSSRAEADAALALIEVQHQPIPREALFLAGKAFREYRRRRGGRTGVLPDFFIGAHAAVLGVPVLSRDAARYGSYFPQVEVVGPGA